MKKILLAGVMCSTLTLGACTFGGEETKNATSSLSGISFYKDSKTGCQYVIYDGYNRAAMVPRMDVDGKQMCNN